MLEKGIGFTIIMVCINSFLIAGGLVPPEQLAFLSNTELSNQDISIGFKETVDLNLNDYNTTQLSESDLTLIPTRDVNSGGLALLDLGGIFVRTMEDAIGILVNLLNLFYFMLFGFVSVMQFLRIPAFIVFPVAAAVAVIELGTLFFLLLHATGLKR